MAFSANSTISGTTGGMMMASNLVGSEQPVATGSAAMSLTVPAGANRCIAYIEDGKTGIVSVFAPSAPATIGFGRKMAGGTNFYLDSLAEMQTFRFQAISEDTKLLIHYFS